MPKSFYFNLATNKGRYKVFTSALDDKIYFRCESVLMIVCDGVKRDSVRKPFSITMTLLGQLIIQKKAFDDTLLINCFIIFIHFELN